MGLQPLYAKQAVPSLWAGLQVSCGKIIVIYLIALIIVLSFILYAMCTNVTVGQIIQPARQLVGEWF
jgi:hypothetical protein